MQIDVQIRLGHDEYASDFQKNTTELAQAILELAGGDPEKDTVNVNVVDTGVAGYNTSASPPPPIRPPIVPEPIPVEPLPVTPPPERV